jgi:hypothetical protein
LVICQEENERNKKISLSPKVLDNKSDSKNEFSNLSSSSNSYKITVRLSSLLIDTLKNIIISNKAGGNFEYTNVSDLLRNALEAYKNGMTLIVQRTKDKKKKHHLEFQKS